MAVRCNDFVMVRYLVENNANVNISAKGYDSPLQAAIRGKKDPEFIKCLLEQSNVNIKQIGGGGETLLATAVLVGDLDVILMLLEMDKKKRLLNRVNPSGTTPLMMAASEGNINAMDALIDAGANPDMVNTKGDTALIMAARKGNKEMVGRLRDKCTNPEAKGHDRLTADEILLKVEQERADKQILREIEGKLKPDMTSADIQEVRGLMGNVTDPNREYHDEKLILSRAIEKGCNEETVGALIGLGASIYACNSYDNDALAVAAAHGDLDMLKFLCGKVENVDINRKRGPKMSPLLAVAVMRGNPEIVGFLLEKGANMNERPSVLGGMTALEYARREITEELFNVEQLCPSIDDPEEIAKIAKLHSEKIEKIAKLQGIVVLLESHGSTS
jgi:ankyrin repeat protein